MGLRCMRWLRLRDHSRPEAEQRYPNLGERCLATTRLRLFTGGSNSRSGASLGNEIEGDPRRSEGGGRSGAALLWISWSAPSERAEGDADGLAESTGAALPWLAERVRARKQTIWGSAALGEPCSADNRKDRGALPTGHRSSVPPPLPVQRLGGRRARSSVGAVRLDGADAGTATHDVNPAIWTKRRCRLLARR